MTEDSGTIFKIKKYAIHDGPGIRTTVFLKGCPLSCWWCHNPEGLKAASQTMLRKDGRKEVVGKRVNVHTIMTEIEKDVIFYDDSGGGTTFSGGEPLLQPEFLLTLLKACGERGIHTAVDTSGYVALGAFEKIIDHCDHFLYDLKIMDPEHHLRFTGSSNRQILANLEFLASRAKSLRIRFPLIPGITDEPDNIERMARWLSDLNAIRAVDILPFHAIAGAKYHRLGMQNRMAGVQPPSEQNIAEIRKQFDAHGIQTEIGG
jgi:pyruvate formate lyase activating enzyme